MSYTKKTEHTISISREDLIEMVEARYGLDSLPSDLDIKSVQTNGYYNLVDGPMSKEPIKLTWKTEETFSSFPEDIPLDAIASMSEDDIPF